jgi:hypothetical protein
VPKELFRLPDLPTTGYATRKQREGTDAIMDFLRKIERDRMRLLTVVVEGPDKWRTIAGAIFRGSAVDSEALDAMFRYLVLMAAKAPDQRRLLDTERNAAAYRDVVTSIMPDIEAQLDQLKLMRKWAP